MHFRVKSLGTERQCENGCIGDAPERRLNVPGESANEFAIREKKKSALETRHSTSEAALARANGLRGMQTDGIGREGLFCLVGTCNASGAGRKDAKVARL
jgi:hypothetical protein